MRPQLGETFGRKRIKKLGQWTAVLVVHQEQTTLNFSMVDMNSIIKNFFAKSYGPTE